MIAVLAAFAVGMACGDDATSGDATFGADGGSPFLASDGAIGEPDAETTLSAMRFAHLAPELGPVDFCYQGAKVGDIVGPVLRGGPPGSPEGDGAVSDASTPQGGDVDGGPKLPSASYRTVSKYLTIEAEGPIRIMIVAAGATSCANPIATGDATLDPSKLSTVAMFSRPGDGGRTIALATFTDDRTPISDKARVRVIHAALGSVNDATTGALAVRAVGKQAVVLADRVAPGKTAAESRAANVDVIGYVTAPPLAAPTALAVGPAETDGGADAGFEPWQSKALDLDLVGSSVHTAFVLGGEEPGTFEVLWCADARSSGERTECTLVR